MRVKGSASRSLDVSLDASRSLGVSPYASASPDVSPSDVVHECREEFSASRFFASSSEDYDINLASDDPIPKIGKGAEEFFDETSWYGSSQSVTEEGTNDSSVTKSFKITLSFPGDDFWLYFPGCNKIFSGVLSNITNITIPKHITEIKDNAFSNCKLLTNIEIPNTVRSIGDYAFSHCFSLSNIIIPNGTTKIGKYAFYDCVSLLNISIPNSAKIIGDNCFNGCSSLKNIKIPGKLKRIGQYVLVLPYNS